CRSRPRTPFRITGSMMTMRGVRATMLVAALTLAGVGCERGNIQEPAGRSVPVALTFTINSSLGGPASAFDRADRIWIRVRAGGATRFEKVFPIDANGGDLRIPFEVRVAAARENASIDIELRFGDAPIFRGTTPIELRVGRPANATVGLDPVPASI